jgi:hypothetical protein
MAFSSTARVGVMDTVRFEIFSIDISGRVDGGI